MTSLNVEIPNAEPRELIAGDTWVWNRRFEDFPSGGATPWTLTYYIRGASILNVVAGADPDGLTFNIVVPATGTGSTAAIVPGSYVWVAKVSNSATGEVYTVAQGDFQILANYATASAGQLQPNAEIMLAAVEAEIAARLGLSASSNGGPASSATSPGSAHNEMRVGDRQLAKIPLGGPEGLYTLRARYKNEIAMLENGGMLPPIAAVFRKRRGPGIGTDSISVWDGP